MKFHHKLLIVLLAIVGALLINIYILYPIHAKRICDQSVTYFPPEYQEQYYRDCMFGGY